MINYTLNIIIPEVRPYVYFKNNQVHSQFKVTYQVLNLLPSVLKKKFIPVEYILGIKNKTGHYNGMIGNLEKNNVDIIYYPLPIDLSDPPGIFTTVFWESSTYIISLARTLSNKNKDISYSLLNFDFNIILLILVFFFILSLFTFKVLKLFSSFCESLFNFFCLTFKQDIKIDIKKNFRFFFVFIILYHCILIMLFEISVSSNLVIQVRISLINTLDDLYKRKDIYPFFIKDHFIINYFLNPYSNKKLKIIFQRVSNCNDCIQTIDKHIINSLLYKNISFENRAFLHDQSNANMFKKIYCTGNHEKINSLGSLYTSLPITKMYFSLLMNKKLNETIRLLINKRIDALRENNLSDRLFYSINQLSFLKNEENSLSFKKCINKDYLDYSDKEYKNIKFKNISISILIFFVFYFLIIFLFFVNILNYLKKKRNFFIKSLY